MHGTDDQIVPVTDADDIASAAQNVWVNLIDGADHRLSVDFVLQALMEEVAEFMRDLLS